MGISMKHVAILFFALSLVIGIPHDMQACTTAIVSGSTTPDGRPLMFKNRDTGDPHNLVRYFEDGAYPYLGVIAASDTLGTRVWQGVNSAGFAIMNALSYNINYGDTATVADTDNGTIIKLALQTCASLDDFERLLNDRSRPLGVEANFGVIDGHGGAAYYETGNSGFTKFDANDPKVAPFGYIVRTNFSFMGKKDKGQGYIRYQTAENLFFSAAAMNAITPEFILRDVARSLKHSLTGENLYDRRPDSAITPVFVHFTDYIPRYSTASATLVQGVRENESPLLATMWTIPGFTLCTVAIPSWVEGAAIPKYAATDIPGGNAPLNRAAEQLKERCFPVSRGSGSNYLDLSKVVNKAGDGYLQLLEPVETVIMDITFQNLEKWREKGFSSKDAARLCRRIDEELESSYWRLFNIDLRRSFEENN